MANAVYHVFGDGPKMVAPYSHAVQVDDWLFVTGQLPFLADGSVPEGIEAQTETVINNIRSVLNSSGFKEAEIVSARVFLTKFEAHYERMNKVYARLFPEGKRPARTCVGVTALASDCAIEIDVIARR